LSVRVIVLGKQGTLEVQSRKESQKDDNKTFHHYLPLAQDVHVSTHNLQCSRQFKKRRQINLFQAFGAETYAGLNSVELEPFHKMCWSDVGVPSECETQDGQYNRSG